MNTPVVTRPLENAERATYWLQRLLYYYPSLFESVRELLETVIAHIPRLVTSRLLVLPEDEPLILFLEGTVVFADVDGFTPLAERFSQLSGDAGAEELTRLINRFLVLLIRTTDAYGGDLLKFGGDSGLLFFKGPGHASRAAAAALEVQRAMAVDMGEVETTLGRFALSASIGLGSGRLIGLGLGDSERREFLLMGNPLDVMARAQSMAPPGEIVVHQSTLAECDGALEVVPLAPSFYRATGLSRPILESRQQARFLLPELPRDEALKWCLSRLDVLSPYLAPGLLGLLAPAPGLDHSQLHSDRRLVTVMMVSLDGLEDPTALWGLEEPLGHVAMEYSSMFVRLRDVVRRYGGVLNKLAIGPAGPYLMALFGAPNSHEDDPLRAVLAALELQEMFDKRLQVGINTGFVFAGDVGTSGRREYTVMGDEVNLAARLMSQGAVGEIWLGPNTARHPTVASHVVLERGLPTRFKGKEQMVAPLIVKRLRQARVVIGPEKLALIGRGEELQQLGALLNRAREGQPSLILLHGEAGVGKSFLVQALAQRAAEQGFAVHIGEATSYGSSASYAGWRRVLLSLLGLEQLPPAHHREALITALERVGAAPWAALVAPVMGLTAVPSAEVLALPPAMRDMQRQSALLSMLEQAAYEQPRLLIFENAQWLPEVSLRLLDAWVEALSTAPMVICVVAREVPSLLGRWRGREQVIDIPLGPMREAEMRSLITEIGDDKHLPDSVVRWIIARSGGLPMFAAEAVRNLIAAGVLYRREDSWEIVGTLDEIGLPDMVYALLQSRIDQLSPADRYLLRTAAVVGHEMTLSTLVAAYSEEPEAAVRRRLPRLAPFGLVPRDPGGQVLVFRQPLVREVAYQGLSQQARRQIHTRLANYYETSRDRAASDWLDRLAFHAFEARLWERAVDANLRLGRRAVRLYLAELARQALARVLTAVETGELSAPDVRYEAHYLLVETLTGLGVYGEALQHLRSAREVARLLAGQEERRDRGAQGISERVAALDYWEATILGAQEQYQEALAIVKHGLSLADVTETVEGARLYLVGADLYRRLKDYSRASAWVKRALAALPSSGGEMARQVRSRAMYMMALLASLKRFQGRTSV